MSQNEMNLNKVTHILTALLFAIAPTFTNAALAPHLSPKAIVRAKKLSVRLKKAKRTPAAINRAALMIAAPSRVFYGENGQSLSPELIANFNHVKAAEPKLEVTDIIPMDMKPTNDPLVVFTQVADRSLTSFFNSPQVRESSIGQAATAVEKKMTQEVVLGSADQDVQHKLNFNVQAFQTTAQIQYTGYTNASLKYNLASQNLALEVFEKVAKNQDVILTQTMSDSDRLSQISYRWNF